MKKWIKEIVLSVFIIVIITNIMSYYNSATLAIDTKKVFKSPQMDIVYFWTSWCSVCKMQAPILKTLSSDIVVKKVQADLAKNQEVVEKFKIKYYPTICYVKKDKTITYCESGLTSSLSIYIKSFLIGSKSIFF